MKLHRNSQKRIYIKDATYFVTVKTLHNEPYFREPILCELFVAQLRLAKRLKGFELYGWFLGYEHFHLIVRPMGEWSYSEIMFSIKKQFSHNANRVMGCGPLFRYNPPKAGNRLPAFGNELGCFDRTIIRSRLRFILKYDRRQPFPLFRWQGSFHDHYIRNDRDFRNHLAYIALNPGKHGLPQNWPYVFSQPTFGGLSDPF